MQTEKNYNVLILCTGNSARSILAEALFNTMGKGRFRAYSAGSRPAGKVNPFALELLQDMGIDTRNLRSKSWDEFAAAGAPEFDFIFTVCDNAAGETCPVWLGHPTTGHWGIEDPAAAEGSDDDKRRAFKLAEQRLRTRIGLFLALPFDKLDALALHHHIAEIGKLREQGR
ncbi:MAG: arsenate reductase ArsC [Pseudomonadota bacterium]